MPLPCQLPVRVNRGRGHAARLICSRTSGEGPSRAPATPAAMCTFLFRPSPPSFRHLRSDATGSLPLLCQDPFRWRREARQSAEPSCGDCGAVVWYWASVHASVALHSWPHLNSHQTRRALLSTRNSRNISLECDSRPHPGQATVKAPRNRGT
jgi:hypothetical protein